MHQGNRDSGLIRAVGFWTLTASIISAIVGAGIFAAPAALAASVGPYAPLALLGCGLAVGAVAICFAEGGSRIPTSGGVYGPIEVALGPLAGYVAGTLVWVSQVLACGGIASALAGVIASLVPESLAMPVRIAVIIGFVGGIALVNIRGVALGARLVGVTAAVKLIPLLIFVVAGAGAIHTGNFSTTAPTDAQGLGHAVILALYAFTGMEASLCASGEVTQPSRTIPRALAAALLTCILLYIAIQVVAQGILGASLGNSAAPLADAMAQISPQLRMLLIAGTALSMFGWLVGNILSSPRLLFALGRDGLLPRVLGRLSHSHTPYVAILCYAVMAIVLALTGSFAQLAVLSALASCPLYIAGCIAAWLLARRGVALAGTTPLQIRWIGLAAVIGIISMTAIVALASRQEILGLMGLVALSAIVYWIQRRGTSVDKMQMTQSNTAE